MKLSLLPIFVFLSFAAPSYAANIGDVVINEIAWMGTTNYSGDEWIELYNNTNTQIALDGWTIRSTDGRPQINLAGTISPYSFFLLERTDDTTLPDHKADQIYTGALDNDGEHLELLDQASTTIDRVNAFGKWPAGDNTTDQTMERKSPNVTGSDPVTWATSINPGGTPKAQNSVVAAGDQEIVADSELITADSSSDSGISEIETPQVPAYPLNIFINELMPYPLGSDELEEWIELINENNDPANISGWQIKDTLGAVNTYILSASMPAKGYLVLSRPTTKITMNNDNDAIQLVRPDGELIQTVPYKNAQKGKSYVRSDGTWKWSAVPTPGSTNIVPALPKETGTIEDIKKVTKKYAASPKPPDPTPAPPADGLDKNSEVASIGEHAPKTQSRWLIPFIASSIALLSSAFIFLLKKRLSRY